MSTLTITTGAEDMEEAVEYVQSLISQGYTSGYYPTWSLDA